VELVLALASAALGPLMVFGLNDLRRRFRERAELKLALGSNATGFQVVGTSAKPPRRDGLGPRRVSLPVATLAGLPVSRPAVEGVMRKRKYENRVAQREAVRRAAVRGCPACDQSRALGLTYCRECRLRLTPFLSEKVPAGR
jgi:hypothetical protein